MTPAGQDLSVRLSLPEQLRQLVELDVLKGELPPNTRVTEEQLSTRYRVSRTPVREAMHLLENQGLLVRRARSGVFVADHSSRDEVEVIYKTRHAVESFLTERAAVAVTPATLEKLEDVHREFRSHLARNTRPDIPALVSLDSQFHWAIYEAAGSDLTGIVTSYWGRLQRELANRVYESSAPATYADQHEEILSALREGDSTAARRCMQHHLKYSSDAILATYETKRASTRKKAEPR
jgi:DNA-binding GntR family transcriptional regulator